MLALVACRSEPELRDRARSLAAWEDGVAALEAGDPGAARADLQQAREAWDGPVLMAWEARAAAESGDLEGAVGLLDEALALQPGLAEARYNRAAYLARLGRLEEAGRELRVALDAGARPAREVLEDPDFAEHLGHPSFAFLPRSWLQVAVEAPREPVFWGSEVSVRLRVLGAEEEPVEVRVPEVELPLQLVEVVEEALPSTAGLQRDVVLTYRVTGAGELALGPLEIAAGRHVQAVPAVELVLTAPEGREAVLHPLRAETPSALRGEREVPAVWRDGGSTWVLLGRGARVRREPARPVRHVWRSHGQEDWSVLRYDGWEPDVVSVSLPGGDVVELSP